MKAGFAVSVGALASACGHFDFDRTSDAGTSDGHDSAPDGDAFDTGELLVHFAFESDGFLRDRVSGADGTCTGCPTTTIGPHGDTAALFDGNRCIRLPAPVAQPQQFTFAVWASISSWQNATLFGRTLNGSTTLDNTFELYIEPSPDRYLAYVNNLMIVSPGSPGAWHHVAGVFDNSVVSLYVDGALEAVFSSPSTQAMYAAGDEITVGCDVDLGNEVYLTTGAIDEVRLYSRALTPAEVSALAQ